MQLYLLTNKDTHARAVVVAPSAAFAQRMRPDDKARFDCVLGKWMRFDHAVQAMREAPPLPCWPTDLTRIHVEELGRLAHRELDGVEQVLAFDASARLRHAGEGPDASWGELFDTLHAADPPLRSLGGKRASTADAAQVEHARWAVALAEKGEYGGREDHLADYRAIVAAAGESSNT